MTEKDQHSRKENPLHKRIKKQRIEINSKKVVLKKRVKSPSIIWNIKEDKSSSKEDKIVKEPTELNLIPQDAFEDIRHIRLHTPHLSRQ